MKVTSVILGAPGCGKTRRCLDLLGRELEAGVPSERIAFVAFTKAAAQEAQDRVTIFGWDLTSSVIAGIDAGFVKAVVQQDPVLIGSASIDTLVAALNGEEVESVVGVPITIVTADNVEPYRAIFE